VTSTGRTVGLVGVLLLAVGGLVHYPELIACGVAALVALGVALLTTTIRCDVTLAHEVRPPRLAEGETGKASLVVTNTGRRRSLPLVATERFAGREIAIAIPSLPPGASYDVSYTLIPPRRGVYAVGPLTVARTDPLGLARARHGRTTAATVWVYPRTHRLGTVPIGRSLAIDGPTFESSPRGGVTFHSLRKYETGNDHRLVHWKSSARVGTLMVRNNVVPSEPSLSLVLDTRAASYPAGVFDEAVRIAASFAVSSLDSGIPTLLLTTGGQAASGQRPGPGRRELLDLLASVDVAPDDPGLGWLSGLRPGQVGLSLVVVTGRPGPASLHAVSLMRHRYETVTVVQVGDPRLRVDSVDGARCLGAATSDEFASQWKKGSAP
jgi:uncharacterized protein (DUF58 family)